MLTKLNSIIKSLKNFSRSFDFFGKNTTLLFKKDKSFRTSLGFCCSIILILLSVVGSFYFLNILLSGSNPNISFSEEKDDSFFRLDQQTFAIGIDFGKNVQISKDLFLTLNISADNIFISTKNLLLQDYCGKIILKNQKMFCLDTSSVFLNLQNKSFENLKIAISLKNRSQILSNFPMTLYYDDSFINSLNYQNPIEKMSQKIEIERIDGFTKIVRMVLQKTQVN